MFRLQRVRSAKVARTWCGFTAGPARLTYAVAAVPKGVSASRASHTTNATTRTRTGSRGDAPGRLVRTGHELASPETGLSYRIDHLLGQGGFGQVYLARRIGNLKTVPEHLCIKVSRRIVDQGRCRGAHSRARGAQAAVQRSADGDQAAPREGPSHHDHQRGAVPAPGHQRATSEVTSTVEGSGGCAAVNTPGRAFRLCSIRDNQQARSLLPRTRARGPRRQHIAGPGAEPDAEPQPAVD